VKTRHIGMMTIALVAGAVLLTVSAGASATAVLTAASDQIQAVPQRPQGPPGPPPGRGGPGGPGRGGQGIDRMIFELDLTTAQIEQVKAIHDEARTAAQPFESQVRAAGEKLRALVEAAAFDEDAVRTLLAGQVKAETELRVIQARADAATYRLLTSEQRSTLAEMRQHPPRPGRGGEMF
jgi:Spy/CpxP family protein refolding chaperone